MAGPNIFKPEFADDWEGHGFFRRFARLGAAAGAKELGATLAEIPPGRTSSPYHLHYGNEEMLIVVAGTPSLRTPAGWRELAEGEVVAFPIGPDGAHQVANFSDEVVRVLIVSTMNEVDVLKYPNTGKTMARAAGVREIYVDDDAVDYWEGEEPPSPPRAVE